MLVRPSLNCGLRALLPRRLGRDVRGLAMIEFALSLPLLLLLGLTGIEYANWIITKMRISQLALQTADNASRMGVQVSGGKTVYEANIAEMFAGGQLQSDVLDVNTNGRIILSSLEPTDVTSTAPTNYIIKWQRCYGKMTSHASLYGVQGNTKPTGMGPTGQLITTQPQNATMFVEVYYVYQPLFSSVVLPSTTFDEIASMAVRDQRNIGQAPTASAGVTAATC